LQGLLGADAVAVPEQRGGRGPADRVGLVPAHAVRLGVAPVTEEAARPWPGHVPAPSPALVHADPAPADVRDASGEVVGVSGRGAVSAAPVSVTLGSGAPVAVETWCGPWPVDERWWDDDAHNRRARIQVVTANGDAHLLALDSGRWWVEATYD
jgi:protein ImuB